jgi:hypothetical protein
VEKVLTVSPPRSRKEVEHFIGLVNFYSTKIRNFADICAPINRLRRNGIPFVWGSQQQRAFEHLKRILASSAVVKPYSLKKDLVLECDASENAIGAVLSQEGHPVMYLSRSLTSAEKNYAVIEREALAIVWAVKRAEKFLLGRQFTIRTDHRALEFVFGENKCLPKHTSARVQRWAIALMGYDYSIEYIRGCDIPHVDALSRLSFAVNGDLECDAVDDGVYWDDGCGVTWTDLVRETAADKLMQGIRRRIKSGNWNACSPAEAQFKKSHAALSVDNEVILLGTRPVVPSLLRVRFIKIAHRSHFGMSITKNHLKQNVWWPGMDRAVEEFVRRCAVCSNKPKANVERVSHKWEVPVKPFERIHIDWAVVPQVGNILILVDAMTGWPEAFICRDRSSLTVKNVLQSTFARFGVPNVVVSDNAKEFISEDIVRWLNGVGAESVQTPQYHSRSNGLVERMVQTIKRALKVWTVGKGDVHSFLQKVLLTYRTSNIAASRDGTPAELMFGRVLRHPLISFQTNNLKYTARPGTHSEPCRYIVQNSPHTVYVDCDGTTRLAHVDQLREAMAENNEDDPDATLPCDLDETVPAIENNADLVRPARQLRRPGWMEDYVEE